MTMASAVSAWRWRRVLRVLDRRWRRRLEADLAGYATERDRTDFLALLDRHDQLPGGGDDTAVLREILWSQQERAERRGRPVAGFGVTRPGL